MIKTTIAPWPYGRFCVEFDSLKSFSSKEIDELALAIRTAFKTHLAGDPWPAFDVVKDIVKKINSELAQQLVGMKYS